MKQKESTTIDINNLLVTNEVEVRRQNRIPNPRQITVLERIKQTILNDEETIKLPEEQALEEKEKLTFRFSDFTHEAQIKFCKKLKEDSTVITIRRTIQDGGKINIDKIWETLKILNPILAKNYRNGFYLGSFNRWKERQLSHIIYHANRAYKEEHQIRHLIGRATNRY